MDGLNFDEQLDKKTKLMISNMEKELETKDAELVSKEKEIKNLKDENDILKKRQPTSRETSNKEISIYQG